MENIGLIISWMKEAIRNLPASLLEPDVGGVLLAIFFLVILYSVVSSQNRIRRDIASVSSELSALRSILRKIESSMERIEENLLAGGGEGKNIWSLPFRLDNDKPKRE